MKLTAIEACSRDAARADRLEAQANTLSRRVTRLIMSSTRRGLRVHHQIRYLETKSTRLRVLANRFRYRPRRKDVRG